MPIKILLAFFGQTDKLMLAFFLWKFKGSRVDKTVLKGEQHWSTHISDFESYYKSAVFKPVWYWHKHTYIEHRNRIKSLEINPCIMVNDFSVRVRTQFNGVRIVFSTNIDATMRNSLAKE